MVVQRSNRIETFGFGVPWEESHGYSQVFRIGDELRIAGQMPHDELGNLILQNDPVAQVDAVFKNMDRVLAAFGARRNQIIETCIYVFDLERTFPPISAAHREYFGDHRPVSSVFGVAALAVPGQLVEITATARLDLR